MLPTQRVRQPVDAEPPAAAGRSTVPGLRWVLANLRRRALLIATLAGVALALGILLTRLTPPLYEAGSLLRLETERANVPQLIEMIASDKTARTEVEVMKGRLAAVAVIDSLGLRARVTEPKGVHAGSLFARLRVAEDADSVTLRFERRAGGRFHVLGAGTGARVATAGVGDTLRAAGLVGVLAAEAARVPAFTLHVAPLASAVEGLMSSVDIAVPSRDVDLISVRARAGDPRQAAAIANLYARNAIASRRASRRELTDSAVTSLRIQSDSLGAQLRATEDSLRAYRQRENAIDVPQQAREEVTRLAALRANLAELRAERNAIASLVAELGTDAARGGGQSAARRLAGFPALLASQSASVLLNALAAVENERAQLLIRRTPNDRDVQALTERARGLEAQLGGIAQSYLQGLDQQVSALEREARGFQTQLDALPAKALETARLERSAKVLSDLYVLLQTRLKESQAAGATVDPALMRVVDSAAAPTRPIRPVAVKNIGVSLAGGLGLGIAVALLLAVADRSVRSRDDAERVTGLPVLGSLPRIASQPSRPRRLRIASGARDGALVERVHGTPRPGAALDTQLIGHPGTPASYTAALNQIFASVAWGGVSPRPRTLVLTSPLPGEGKTLTAINLALLAASHGLNVLLIDGDLHRGDVGKALGIRSTPGFSELLQRLTTDDEAIRRVESVDGDGKLDVIPAGASSPKRATGVVALDRVQEVIERLAPRYDRVLIDSPPANLFADAGIIGAAADGVLLVVRAGHTKANDLQYAVDRLTATRASIVGTVLNDVDRRHGADDDASYRYMEEAARYG
jgi:capsular exopolysaccharide synthesis family protein